jgi:3-hydroxybutyryl-CoA dehydrogenase
MKIAVIGTGVMGRGWITQCAMTGNEVHCHDANPDILAGTVKACIDLAEKTAKRFKITEADFAAATGRRITTHSDKAAFVAAAGGCDVFLEVIFEDMQLKRRVLGELLPQLPEQVMFWSNTSSLDIDKLADAGGRPERSIITHGFNPVPMMPGVEVVPGARTSPETVEFARQALLAMKKAPFLAPNIPGFWVNRLLVPMALDAVRLLEQGKIRVEDGDVGLNTSLGHPLSAPAVGADGPKRGVWRRQRQGILRLERPAQARATGSLPLRGRHRRADDGSAEMNKEGPRGQGNRLDPYPLEPLTSFSSNSPAKPFPRPPGPPAFPLCTRRTSSRMPARR